MTKRVALITVHECPLASSEGKERGGINVYTHELGKALASLGWEVDAFTRIQDDINPREVNVTNRFRVIHLPNGPHTLLSKNSILSHLPEFTDALSEYAHSHKRMYDVVHAHYYLSGIAAMTLKLPTVMTFHTLGLMKLLVASEKKDSEESVIRMSIERDITAFADRIITASDTGATYLTSFYDAPKENIRVIPPGVDVGLFHPMDRRNAREKIGTPDTQRMILAVGRIDPVKGFDVLLSAVKILLRQHPELQNDVCLCIVGGDMGQTKSEWSRELKRLNSLRSALRLTTSVRFVSPQPQEQLPFFYNAADVVVMPSHYESFGMVALEALACGTPVIATDVTGISPIIKEFPQGHVISANNPVLLAEKIKHVLSNPHQRIPIHFMKKSFDWRSIGARITDVYEELL